MSATLVSGNVDNGLFAEGKEHLGKNSDLDSSILEGVEDLLDTTMDSSDPSCSKECSKKSARSKARRVGADRGQTPISEECVVIMYLILYQAMFSCRIMSEQVL